MKERPLGLHAVARLPSLLRELIAPHYCAACDEPISGHDIFCVACGPCPPLRGALPPGTRAAGVYAPPLSTAILRMKFGPRADVADRLSPLLDFALRDLDGAPAVVRLVAPVPLHPARLVDRGFNPSALLARSFARRQGFRFTPDLLARQRDTPQQSRLGAAERRSNVCGAFSAAPGSAGQTVLLIDDVVTTGSTVEACRQALYAAGALHVTVLALALAAA